jgi:hypothetical protein
LIITKSDDYPTLRKFGLYHHGDAESAEKAKDEGA